MWIDLTIFESGHDGQKVTVNVNHITHYRTSAAGNHTIVYLAVPKGDGQVLLQITETPDQIWERIEALHG